MTKKRFHELGVYARALADEMGLRDWTFVTLDQEPETPPEYNGTDFRAEATCTPTPGQHTAVLRFRSDFDENRLEDIRNTVVHELLHCHMQAMHEMCRSVLLNEISQSTYNVFMGGFDMNWEYAIDGISRAWAAKLPLIQWPVEKRK